MKNKKMMLVICILLLVSLVGCRPAQRLEPRTTPAPGQQGMDRDRVTDDNVPGTGLGGSGDNRMPTDNDRSIVDNRTMDGGTIDGGTTDGGTMDGRSTADNMGDRTNRIVREIENIKDVRRATAVITERTALVGVDLTSGTKGELNNQIKRDIEDAVRRVDRDITRVSVTADPDIFTRIENVARDVGKGRPLSGFGSEIEEIIRRITPGT